MGNSKKDKETRRIKGGRKITTKPKKKNEKGIPNRIWTIKQLNKRLNKL